MDHKETKQLLAFMGEMYPNSQKPSLEYVGLVIETWQKLFSDVPFDTMLAAAKNHLVFSNFMPSVKEMTDQVMKITNPELYTRTHDDAFANALEAVWRFGYIRPDKAKVWLDERDPLTWQALEALGGYGMLCKSEAGDTAIKAQFRDAYNAFKNRQHDFLLSSLSQLTPLSSPQIGQIQPPSPN